MKPIDLYFNGRQVAYIVIEYEKPLTHEEEENCRCDRITGAWQDVWFSDWWTDEMNEDEEFLEHSPSYRNIKTIEVSTDGNKDFITIYFRTSDSKISAQRLIPKTKIHDIAVFSQRPVFSEKNEMSEEIKKQHK